MREVFGETIDYATEIKVFGKDGISRNKRYNPVKIVGIKRRARLGNPDMDFATTCHAERTNLSARTFTRRLTRCTLGYSKKVENLRHAIAMFVCHFNYCRVHSAHKQTPAQAAGLTDKVWTIAELLESAI